MAPQLINSTGKLTMLRAHEVGSKFGPPNDSIDVEVVVKLNTVPDRAMGFQLRDNANALAHTGMLDLLRDAFTGNVTVSLDYSIDLEAGKKNGTILRVVLQR